MPSQFKYTLIALGTVILASFKGVQNPTVISPEGYELVWNEEFEYKGILNPEYWTFEEGFIRNMEMQYYQSGNAKVRNGKLVIRAKRERVKNPAFDPESENWRKNRPMADYTSASITTKGKKEFTYGIFEFRARFDPQEGLWPAIWTLGTERPWPENGEIDILEFFRIEDVPTMVTNVVWLDENGEQHLHDSKTPLHHFLTQDPDWAKKFHIWKLEWTEEHIKIYIDDELFNEVTLTDTYQPDGFNPFQAPHYILINLAIGAGGGDPSNTRFPRKFEVDYVRVFQKVR
ncbi:glycoside hydrolase family 16 protein [Litoribacter alkaliphilus]|uniref:Glycoside hydrolase family 16 protein n=1 Tax=Litoribacter ruber TaxID=702568 RepID=A0AAP2G273_9BACT|nr:glycoside hydrolase family 16 protein [Litoribacter alkaliphilus]MBS9525322.1 glycoside hydrolase family 16 protein [Litoribacter alkaliphilus]